jgi:rhamnosyltransferase
MKDHTTSTCALVVTYNPGATIIANIDAVKPQVGYLVVIDNGSLEGASPSLATLEALPGCTVIRNNRNLGIAAALNLGVRYALDKEFEFVFTFDQDSKVSETFVSQMLDTYMRAPNRDRVALIAPRYVDQESGMPGKLMRSGNNTILATMASGSMIPLHVIREVGDFDESLFMDYVDFDFCLRTRRQGMHILQSTAVLFHSLGRTTYYRFLGLAFGATNHSAARRYYITRNRFRLMARYAADWSWTWREVRAVLFELVKIILVEDDKRAKLRAMITGSFDALTGKTGKTIDL